MGVEPRQTDFYTDATPMGQKALVSEHDGDLYIEGWAADIALDDQDEHFTAKALTDAAADFMASGNTPLLFHHKTDMQLGEVTLLEPRRRDNGNLGLWMKARVERPAASHPILSDAYQKIARGTLRGLSVGGRFFGKPSAQGTVLERAKFREISVAPLPVNSTTLASLAAKAFQEEPEPCTDCEERAKAEEAVSSLKETVNALGGLWDAMRGKAAPTAEQRKKYGMADGSFPVWHCGSGPGSVKSAMKLSGHGNQDKAKVLAHIRRRASALGCPEQAKRDDD